jgi:hypothetical protein
MHPLVHKEKVRIGVKMAATIIEAATCTVAAGATVHSSDRPSPRLSAWGGGIH